MANESDTNMKPFYFFICAVVLSGVAFGFYAAQLGSCKESGIGVLECYKLYLAFGVLFTVAVLLVVGAGLYALVPSSGSTTSSGQAVFDGFIKALPPIATLVLGYYFGSSQTASKPQQDSKPAAVAAAPSEAGSAASGVPAKK